MRKIVVLFGSFNPFTNAHLAVMKAARDAIHADLGLFVATNRDYMRRKMTKRKEGFRLTEEERKDCIEKICEAESGLAFWGFELGGASPKRYKTLCEIKNDYPEEEIYEIEGADKVKSIGKFKDSAEYVGNMRYLIIGRDGIDVHGMIESNPLLKKNEDRFTLLPPISGQAELSSTEVRRRFFAGVDYSNLVPDAVAELLKTHRPEEFAISFPERMRDLIETGGRFGDKNARIEVYKENLSLFLDWKKGKDTGIDFGDYQTFLNNTKLYRGKHDVSGMGTVYPGTVTYCANMDCVDMACGLIEEGYHPALLNLASAKHPGGGYEKGSPAQEESLCRSSNLSISLYQYGNPKKMKSIRDCEVPVKDAGYPLDTNYGGIYTPDVTFFRYGKSRWYALREEPFHCDVITVAALSFSDNHMYSEDEKRFKAADGSFTPEGNEVMLNKIRTIFRMGVEHGRDALVLGAFGCGVYKLPVPEVVKQFRTVMEEQEFRDKFKLIIFAILEGKRGPNEHDGKYGAFYQEFGPYRECDSDISYPAYYTCDCGNRFGDEICFEGTKCPVCGKRAYNAEPGHGYPPYSIRTYNILKWAGAPLEMDEVMKLSDEELLGFRNMCPESMEELDKYRKFFKKNKLETGKAKTD